MSSSADLNWLIIRNNNAHLLKKTNIKKPFSTERNNLTNVSSFRYSGLVHSKTLAVVPADKTGFTVVYKKQGQVIKPAKSSVRVTFKHGARRSLKKLKNLLRFNKYRADLRQAALRRASAVIRSQKVPKSAKKAKVASAAPAANKKLD
ncbi:60S ribosomal protein L28 [Pseudolycoriella hygida]|uniref:Large ribosomal subunit protein eL28 n=1 Tax=Pseudolycoriella hygida TaxID=35572 RepID=A0A9Q0N3H1_9DIPT|nr:60S ribosomal protein L28 [Pseudolycoriella hygida]